MIYLDNSATTRQADEVTEAMIRVMREDFGNPSSLYPLGLAAQNLVTKARGQVAGKLSVSPDEITFTSCGTEGDNSVIFGTARARRHQGRKIITTKVEHPAVLEACKVLEDQGYQIVYLPVDGRGMPDLDLLKEELDGSCILVSMMAVNNETGSILPVREAAAMAHEAGALFHTDAVQAFGKVDLKRDFADFITISGHKILGPKGIGATYVRKGVNLPPRMVGGGQEKNRRSGTENVPGIVGLGTAASLLSEEDVRIQQSVSGYLLRGIRDQIKDIRVNSPEGEDRAPSVLNVSFLGTRGEVILHTLEGDGICVSTGSACSSNKKGRSHVLSAMGLSEKEIEGAIRFSFCRYNTIEEMDVVLDRLKAAVTRFRRLGSFR